MPDPELAQELHYLAAWLTGTEKSLLKSVHALEGAIDATQADLHEDFLTELAERRGTDSEQDGNKSTF